jgi:hypothetical protein
LLVHQGTPKEVQVAHRFLREWTSYRERRDWLNERICASEQQVVDDGNTGLKRLVSLYR